MSILSCWGQPNSRRLGGMIFAVALTALILPAIANAAESFRILYHFPTVPTWREPVSTAPNGSLLIDQGMIYGVTYYGGVSNVGTIYKISVEGTGYTTLKEFTDLDGHEPRAGLVKAGDVLYGTTLRGGSYTAGVVFKINIDGTGFEVLHHFDETIAGGKAPAGSEPLLLVGDSLFGMTQGTGASNGVALGWGTVYRIRTNGTGFAILKNFPGKEESYPWSGLVLAGDRLYGTTSGWATDNRGTVFRMGLDGNDYGVLWRFAAGADAAFPLSGVVISGNTLFGTTYYGPNSTTYGSGTLFRMNLDGSGLTRLHLFDTNGWWPREGLILSDGVIYGTTSYTPTGYGGVYALSMDGSAFAMLRQFRGPDGTHPTGLGVSGRTLYGVSGGGGNLGGGVLFAMPTAPPAILANPSSRTVEAGQDVPFTVKATGFEPLTVQLIHNGTNLLLSGASRNLVLTNVQMAQAGSYVIRVTNRFGAAASIPADLDVVPPVARRTVPGLVLNTTPPGTIHLLAASTLAPAPDWAPLDTVQVTQPDQWYFDTNGLANPAAFYRGWHSNGSAPPFSLSSYPVPMVTLTGQPGSTVRLDYIPETGPTGAWVTLGTFPLAQPSQSFFDTNAIGQARRVYRLTPVP